MYTFDTKYTLILWLTHIPLASSTGLFSCQLGARGTRHDILEVLAERGRILNQIAEKKKICSMVNSQRHVFLGFPFSSYFTIVDSIHISFLCFHITLELFSEIQSCIVVSQQSAGGGHYDVCCPATCTTVRFHIIEKAWRISAWSLHTLMHALLLFSTLAWPHS